MRQISVILTSVLWFSFILVQSRSCGPKTEPSVGSRHLAVEVERVGFLKKLAGFYQSSPIPLPRPA